MRSAPTAWLLPFGLASLVLALGVLVPGRVAAQEESRAFTVVAKKYEFRPAVIEVRQDDLVKITFQTEDVAHSFTVDGYRIAKRSRPGQPVTFEFRADRVGSFTFYCDMKADEGCRRMRGTLVVKPR